MIVRKTLLAASAAALMSTPAWALPSQTPSNPGTAHAPSTTPVGPPSTTPNNTNNPGSANRDSHANKGDKGSSGANGNRGSNSGGNDNGNGDGNDQGKGSHPGTSNKCMAHMAGYVASGTLVLATPPLTTLTKNADGTYSGTLEVEVTRTNRHAAADKGKTVIYKVMSAHVTFGLTDTNNDGSVGLDDLVKGDRVHLNGKITALAKKCNQSGFTAETTIRRIIFHAPAGLASNKD
jgi:hypothetical protein